MGKNPAINKKCSKCQLVKPVSEFYKRPHNEPGYHYMCKVCMRAYYKNRWKNISPENRDLRRIKFRKWFNQLKEEIFNHYGRKCACCGEEHSEFLTIDHINGGGTKHRKLLGGGNAFFKWLRNNNYPKEYQILCINCNFAKGRFGYCPHKKER